MNIFSRKNNTKAFTLIEIMVTVIIIAILSSLILSGLSESRKRSRDAKRISDANQLKVALELFFDRCGRYPTIESVQQSPNYWTHMPKLKDSLNGCPTGVTLETFISKLPSPSTSGDYRYWINADPAPSPIPTPPPNPTPSVYYLRARLETKNKVLDEDIDGNTSSITNLSPTSPTIDCNESSTYYYCLGSQ